VTGVCRGSPSHSLQAGATQTTSKEKYPPPPPTAPLPHSGFLQRKAAPDKDPAEGVPLAIHGHRGTDLQVPEGIQAGDSLKEGLPGHVAKIWALDRGHTLAISLW
jgi:hypothetical protein